jgi:hypothetical protein
VVLSDDTVLEEEDPVAVATDDDALETETAD